MARSPKLKTCFIQIRKSAKIKSNIQIRIFQTSNFTGEAARLKFIHSLHLAFRTFGMLSANAPRLTSSKSFLQRFETKDNEPFHNDPA